MFPFSALAGQPMLRTALLLAAIDPALGGVLIEGPRGTAKSTAAKALAELLPDRRFVALPLGASVEHVVGSLDLGEALAGHTLRFAPGLLAKAHGGVLYVDEANLLPDALIDVLLDVAASGVNVVEREGISHRHAARFVLVGTMNPEEGELRPQLLDRFGLCVRLHNLTDPAERSAVVRQRLAFDADPQRFRERHAEAQRALVVGIEVARARLADAAALPFDDALTVTVSRQCIEAGVDGLRADLVMLRAARAWAAWEGAPAITAQHLAHVAELVLVHRRHPDVASPAPTSTDASATASPASSEARPASAGQDQAEPSAEPDSTDDWGALAPEPAGLTRVKTLRPLARSVAKKA